MKYLTIWILLFIAFSINAQTPNYSRVKVDLTQKSIIELSKLGLALEHGFYKERRFLINEFSNIEIEKIKAAGFEYEILIEDLDDFYLNQNAISTAKERNNSHCDGSPAFDYNTPENFELGSFMGFLTYEELLENLDSMAAKYPDLISPRQQIDTFLTFENRPVYWLKISDNPLLDEEEPEALYTALHHAREPMSLSSMIFYMWYLLENYETNPAIQYLIDHTELYFIPCVNPDGYVYNVANYQNGESFLWRKNRRDNNDGTFGVDLNRNYAYQWAYDNNGSSSDPGSDVYRGEEAFSEPETEAIQSFCNTHEFQICLNNHTKGNLLFYPWNYLEGTVLADSVFLKMSAALVAENHFLAGTVDDLFGNPSNGNADDWMFGEMISKPSIYAFTPEIGPNQFGFYPPESEIINLCKSVLLQNLKTGYLLLNYGEVKEKNEAVFSETDAQFIFKLTRYGLMDGTLTVNLSPISDNIESVGDSKNFDLAAFAVAEDSIAFSLKSDISTGEEIIFLLSVYNGGFILSDTIKKVFGRVETIFADNGDNLDQWDSAIDPTHLWGLSFDEFHSASSSITDSPDGVYFSWLENYLEMDEPILLTDTIQAFLTFWAKWDIENDYDYAQISISTNGWAYTPLCGKYTNLGTEDQDEGEPLYDGEQLDWVKEEIDLSDYLGQEIYLRFSMISNAFNNGDGFYFDDLKIKTLVEDIVAIESLDVTNFTVKTNPNPAADYVNLEFSKSLENGNLLVYNTLGELVFTKKIQNKKGITLNSNTWNPGIYFCRIINNSGMFITERIVIVD
jgi:hypothetical protein